jgi:uncharacterized membrane protein YjjP (DUF1212 family)
MNSSQDARTFGSLLLDIGIGLLKAGSSGRRIRITLTKTASAYNYLIYPEIGPKSISISLLDNQYHPVFNGTRSTNSYGVDFKIMSAAERLTASISKRQWSMIEITAEANRFLSLPKHPFIAVLLAVSLAGAAFCYTFGGNLPEMAIAFGATCCGLFLKHQLQKRSINVYAITFLSALLASLFVGVFHISVPSIRLENAYATCALFLIPGVPLINSIIDLVDGNILYGLERGMNAMIHALAIAFGLTSTLYIFNLMA